MTNIIIMNMKQHVHGEEKSPTWERKDDSGVFVGHSTCSTFAQIITFLFEDKQCKESQKIVFLYFCQEGLPTFLSEQGSVFVQKILNCLSSETCNYVQKPCWMLGMMMMIIIILIIIMIIITIFHDHHDHGHHQRALLDACQCHDIHTVAR